jgi:hypothetical protein
MTILWDALGTNQGINGKKADLSGQRDVSVDALQACVLVMASYPVYDPSVYDPSPATVSSTIYFYYPTRLSDILPYKI